MNVKARVIEKLLNKTCNIQFTKKWRKKTKWKKPAKPVERNSESYTLNINSIG